MKILIACFLLSIVGLSFATPYYYPLGGYKYTALLKSLANTQQGELPETESDDGDDNIADLQAIFNVMAQIDIEKAKAIEDKSAMAQFWKKFRKTLYNAGKTYLKYYTKEKEMKAMLQELIGQKAIQDEDNDSE